ncbi:hypothetical protein ACS0TY_002889 [Phlomoides rotata]
MTWSVVNITGFAVMALLGEYLCMRRELRDIPIGRFRSRMSTPIWIHFPNGVVPDIVTMAKYWEY